MSSLTQTEKANQLDAFGPAWDAAGTRGFFGEGYWYHPFVPGLSFKGSTFVAKTMTTYPNAGNTPLTERHAPKRLFPDSIKLYPVRGMALNAVGLSNPGSGALFNTEHWERILKPFFLSWMPILNQDHSDFHYELSDFINMLWIHLPYFWTSDIGIQLNISCPNVSADLSALVQKASRLLDAFTRLRYSGMPIPVVLKLNLLVPPQTAVELAQHPACYGICIANSLPFGTFLPKDWWRQKFPAGSPLTTHGYGPGGLSGAPLMHFVAQWVKGFRKRDEETYLNVGGGILCAEDVDVLAHAGANSIFIGSAAMLRPWRVRGIIRRAHEVF